jgi:hypothetical protein
MSHPSISNSGFAKTKSGEELLMMNYECAPKFRDRNSPLWTFNFADLKTKKDQPAGQSFIIF